MKASFLSMTAPRTPVAQKWVRTIPGVGVRNGRMTVPADVAAMVVRQLNALGEWPHVYTKHIPPPTAATVGMPLRGLADGIPEWLLPHQLAGIEFFRKRGACLLRWPAGAGKTVGSVAAAQQQPHGRVAVVTLAGHKRHWRSEIERTSIESAIVVDGHDAFVPGGARYIVLGWEILDKHVDALIALGIGVAIFDESQRMKDRKGVWGKAARKLAVASQSVIMATATPAPDRVRDWYPQLDALAPWAFGAFWGTKDGRVGFAQSYCEGHSENLPNVGEIWKADGCNKDRMPELRDRLKFYVHNVSEAQALGAMPPLRRTVHYIPHGELLSDRCKREKVARGDAESQFEASLARAARRKRPQIVDLLATATASKQKAIVFTGRHDDVEAIGDAFRKIMPDGCWLRAVHGGDTTAAQREAIFGLVRRDGTYPPDSYMGQAGPAVLITTGDVAGTGINLQDTDHLILAMLPWNPGRVHQYEGRVRRLGGKRKPQVHYLVAEGTVDERVAEHLLEKLPPYSSLDGPGEMEELKQKLSGEDDPKALLALLMKATGIGADDMED